MSLKFENFKTEKKQEQDVEKLVLEKIDLEKLENELQGIFSEEHIQETVNKVGNFIDAPYKNSEEFRKKVIKESVESFARLILEIKENIDTYDAILSDDASGRLVALTLEKVLNKDKEEEKLPLYFVASGRNSDDVGIEIAKFLKKHNEIKKALVVTEYIASGASINEFSEIIKRQGIDFDIASFAVQDNKKLQEIYPDLYKKIITGKEDSDIGYVYYGNQDYTGVRKLGYAGVRGGNTPHPVRVHSEARDTEKIINAREETSILAEELYKLIEE